MIDIDLKNENKSNDSMIHNQNPNNIFKTKKVKQNNIFKSKNKTLFQDNKVQILSRAIKTIEINTVKGSQYLSMSSSKEQNSKKPMNINLGMNEISSRNKRKQNSKKDSLHLSNKTYSHIEENKVINENSAITCRQKLTRFLEINNRLFYIRLFICLLSFLSFFYYIACTYINTLYPSLNYIDYFICTIYIIEHLIKIILSHHFFTYIISIDSLISFLLEIMPFFVFLCKNYDLNYLYRTINMTRVLRLLKGYKIVELLQSGEKDINYQILYIIITLIIIMLIWAGIIQISDLGYVTRQLKITFETLNRHNLLLRKQFHHYIYFSLISLTTVGYGEIIPSSALSRVMIILMVIIILVIVPEQTNEIINLSNAQTIYERKKYISSPEIPYIVILGDIDLITLKNFSKEYFHVDHGERYRHIVILMNKPPDKDIELFLNSHNNAKFIIYLQGDPMNYENLFRADILNANSCIIFTRKNMMTINKENWDHQTLLLALFIKKFYYHTTLENNFLNDGSNINDSFLSEKEFRKKIKNIFKKKNFKLCFQLYKSESSNFYYSTLQKNYKKNMISDKLLIIESLKMNLLSKSCVTPGIIALISNLIISSVEENEKIFKKQVQWQKEYKEGQQYEIYKYKNIQGDLLFYSFQQLTQEIYNKYHCILIALEINYHGGTLVKLNPQSKEKLIDILYSFLSIKSRNITMNEGIIKLSEQPNVSLLESYTKEYDLELAENIIKRSNINFKKVRMNLYIISKGRKILDYLKQLDEGNQFISPIGNKPLINITNINNSKNKTTEEQQSQNKDISVKKSKTLASFANKLKKNTTLKHNKNNNPYSSDNDSVLSNEMEGNESARMKVDLDDNNSNNNNEADEDLSDNYYLMTENERHFVFTNEIIRQGINESKEINHHIVICGMHQEIIHFILPLRNKYLPEKLLKWIVILAPFLPEEIHQFLCKFPKIIFIKGDPLFPENLFRANIISADIAVILNSSYIFENKQIDLNEIFENDNNFNNNINNSNIFNKINLDAKTIFIYKSIKNINKSIQIITELLCTNNIEFLLSSKHLIKLYNNSKDNKEFIDNGNSKINDESEDNIKEYLLYELTPVFAAGEVYLPSLIDKIIAQIYYNSNILSILNLLLLGEKTPDKFSDKKLAQMIDIKGTNLFLIPCESRTESFSDMFIRLLNEYNMISIALYRKNMQENFYYVYTNPRKTTLIRENDMVFVLSSTENIINIYEKNLIDITSSQLTKSVQINKSENQAENLFKNITDYVKKEIRDEINNKKEDTSNINLNLNRNNKVHGSKIFMNLLNYKENRENSSILKNKNKKDEKEKIFKKGRYQEIDGIQNKLDKIINIYKEINNKCKNTNNDIDNCVKREITNEMLFYVNKNK